MSTGIWKYFSFHIDLEVYKWDSDAQKNNETSENKPITFLSEQVKPCGTGSGSKGVCIVCNEKPVTEPKREMPLLETPYFKSKIFRPPYWTTGPKYVPPHGIEITPISFPIIGRFPRGRPQWDFDDTKGARGTGEECSPQKFFKNECCQKRIPEQTKSDKKKEGGFLAKLTGIFGN